MYNAESFLERQEILNRKRIILVSLWLVAGTPLPAVGMLLNERVSPCELKRIYASRAFGSNSYHLQNKEILK